MFNQNTKLFQTNVQFDKYSDFVDAITQKAEEFYDLLTDKNMSAQTETDRVVFCTTGTVFQYKQQKVLVASKKSAVELSQMLLCTYKNVDKKNIPEDDDNTAEVFLDIKNRYVECPHTKLIHDIICYCCLVYLYECMPEFTPDKDDNITYKPGFYILTPDTADKAIILSLPLQMTGHLSINDYNKVFHSLPDIIKPVASAFFVHKATLDIINNAENKHDLRTVIKVADNCFECYEALNILGSGIGQALVDKCDRNLSRISPDHKVLKQNAKNLPQYIILEHMMFELAKGKQCPPQRKPDKINNNTTLSKSDIKFSP